MGVLDHNLETPCSVNAVVGTVGMRYVLAGGADGVVSVWDLPQTVNGEKKMSEAAKNRRPDLVEEIDMAGVLRGYFPSLPQQKTYRKCSLSAGFTAPGKTKKARAAKRKAVSDLGCPSVSALAVDAQTVFTAVGTVDGHISLVSLRSALGKPLAQLQGHQKSVTGLALLPGPSPLLVSASEDGSSAVWDMITTHPVATFSPDTPTVFSSLSVLGDPDALDPNARVALASFSGSTYLWDPRSPPSESISSVLKGETAASLALSVASSWDGNTVYVGHAEYQNHSRIRVYDVRKNDSIPAAEIHLKLGSGRALTIAPAPLGPWGDLLLVGCERGVEKYSATLDETNPKARFCGRVKGHSDSVAALATSSSIPFIVSASCSPYDPDSSDHNTLIYTIQ